MVKNLIDDTEIEEPQTEPFCAKDVSEKDFFNVCTLFPQAEPGTAVKEIRPAIDWDGYVLTKLIPPETADVLAELASRLPHDGTIFDSRPEEYAKALLTVLNNLANEDAVSHVVAVISIVLHADAQRLKHFTRFANSVEGLISPIVRLLTRPADGTSSHADDAKSVVLASFACALLSLCYPSESQSVSAFMDWLCVHLNSSKETTQALALKWLSVLLKKEYLRRLFIKSNGLYLVAPLIAPNKRDSIDVQMLYHSLFALWMVSYCPDLVDKLDEGGVIVSLVDIVKMQPKEKILRMALAILRNMLGHKRFDTEMIEQGLPKYLEALQAKNWADEDIKDDVETLIEALEKNMRVLSSFEMFQQEINTGKVDWGPAHTEKFWRENATKFEQNNYQSLKVMVRLLETSVDDRIRAVICHDLGEFARIHPRGRSIVNELGAKRMIMGLMESNNSCDEVKKHALGSISKMMINDWEHALK